MEFSINNKLISNHLDKIRPAILFIFAPSMKIDLNGAKDENNSTVVDNLVI